MSDSTQVDSPHRISRRTVVKGGLVAGGALWAVPAVQVLTATKAFAATASGTTTTVGISYVMLVLEEIDGTIITAKVDQSGSLDCPGSASSDIGTRWDDYLSTNFPTHTSGGCPSDLVVVSHTATSVTVNLGANQLLGFMVHDGTLPHASGKVGFASGTTLPSDSIYLPSGWTAPSVGATGTVTFAEPS